MVKTNMKNEKQTKIDEFDGKEIVEEKADERTKISQIKKLKHISKIIDEMIIELEPKLQSKSDESIPKDKSNFGFNFGSKSPEKKFNFGSFGSKDTEKKFNFGSNHKESKPSFGFKSPEKKSPEKKFDFGSISTEIKTIPVTSKKLQPAWKPKQE